MPRWARRQSSSPSQLPSLGLGEAASGVASQLTHLLVLPVVPSDCAVSRLRFDRLSIRADQDRRHETQRAKACNQRQHLQCPHTQGGGGEDTIAEAVKAFLPEARVARLQGPLSTLKGASASARANVTRLPE